MNRCEHAVSPEPQSRLSAMQHHLPRLLAEIGLVIGFLSRIPVPNLNGEAGEAGDAILGHALRFSPVAGFAIAGVPAFVVALGRQLVLPPLATATLAVAAAIWTTGALHEDGLADVADGFGGGTERDRKLAIMRDSRIGTFGAAALVCSIVLRVACLAQLIGGEGSSAAVAAIVVAACLSRALMLLPMAVLKPARRDGLARNAGGVTCSGFAVAIGLAFVLAGLASVYGGYTLTRITTAFGVAALGCIAMTALSRRQIGGVTGDVVGASQQCAEIAVLLTLSAGTGPM